MGNIEKKAFGTHSVAKICGVTRHTVAKWIDEDKIPAYITGGGQKRVWASDLVRFLKSHNIPVPSSLSSYESVKVLVVDDEEPVREMLTRVVKSRYPDIELNTARDGFQAGHLMDQCLPDLVILDLMIPGLNGWRICQYIRSNHKFKSTHILAISGSATKEDEKSILKAGADGFLPKPIEPQDLLRQMEKLIGLFKLKRK